MKMTKKNLPPRAGFYRYLFLGINIFYKLTFLRSNRREEQAMSKFLVLLLTLLFVSGSTAGAVEKITVSSMVELLNSIGSDRIIFLTPGVYKLSDALGFTSRNAKNIYERRMYITGVHNLKIIATGPGKTELLSPYSDSDVLLIKDCSDLELQNFSIGHVQQPKGCEGDALRMEASEKIKFDRMDIYGCGENGLTLRYVDQLEVKDSYIHHCTYNLLDLSEVTHTKFVGTKFVHNGNFSVLNTSDKIQGLEFDNCQISVDPTRKVHTYLKGDPADYAAKYSLAAQNYDQNWWVNQQVTFKDCTFENVNPLEVTR
jgi:hypothetical protein